MMDLSHLDRDRKEQYLKLLQAKNIRIKQNKITQYYPDDGPLSRDNYPKHMQFFAAGADFSERCIMAANRIGKSEGIGAYETTLHEPGAIQVGGLASVSPNQFLFGPVERPVQLPEISFSISSLAILRNTVLDLSQKSTS